MFLVLSCKWKILVKVSESCKRNERRVIASSYGVVETCLRCISNQPQVSTRLLQVSTSRCLPQVSTLCPVWGQRLTHRTDLAPSVPPLVWTSGVLPSQTSSLPSAPALFTSLLPSLREVAPFSVHVSEGAQARAWLFIWVVLILSQVIKEFHHLQELRVVEEDSGTEWGGS